MTARRLEVDAEPTGGLIIGRSDATACHVAGQYPTADPPRCPTAIELAASPPPGRARPEPQDGSPYPSWSSRPSTGRPAADPRQQLPGVSRISSSSGAVKTSTRVPNLTFGRPSWPSVSRYRVLSVYAVDRLIPRNWAAASTVMVGGARRRSGCAPAATWDSPHIGGSSPGEGPVPEAETSQKSWKKLRCGPTATVMTVAIGRSVRSPSAGRTPGVAAMTPSSPRGRVFAPALGTRQTQSRIRGPGVRRPSEPPAVTGAADQTTRVVHEMAHAPGPRPPHTSTVAAAGPADRHPL